jgi:hypothetical protein
MWTFDYPPMDYFAKTYKFSPTKEWFEKARLAAIRLPNCSASFISEDGLVMSNHHCARSPLDRVNRPGEDLPETGFYAATLEDERKAPGTFVDQLQLIEDVTKEVQEAYESGKTDKEKVEKRNAKMKEIETRYKEKTKLDNCQVYPFYNGGRYSLYGFKRYSDVRIVFAVETQIGFYGGDPDNFTYPRYDVDLSLFRIYDDDGKPLKPKYYFKFSKDGVKEGDPIFVIGNPGRTSRLLTVSQLEFNRDYAFPFTLSYLDNLVSTYSKYIEKHPEKKLEMQTQLFGFSNAQKAYGGQVAGLKDPILMARKFDFEKKFKDAVMKDPKLKAKYGAVWDEIEKIEKERSNLFYPMNAFNFRGRTSSPFFTLAANLVDYAIQMKMPEDKRLKDYKGPALDLAKGRMVLPKIDPELDAGRLTFQLEIIKKMENRVDDVKKFFGGKTSENLAAEIIKSSILNDSNEVKKLVNGDPDEILKLNDPVISFVAKAIQIGKDAREKMTALNEKETPNVQLLGNAIYDVYGTQMPPDATFTLRIADGVVKGYEYNGTIAPPITTFYGMYDRHYSFNKPDWDLPPRWKNPPPNFKLSTPVNFVATADIIGGNSGSPVINKEQEIVGLVFDGNIESLPGEFIFVEDKNRTVAVHSSGILEALENIYKADRIVKEIKAGKIVK